MSLFDIKSKFSAGTCDKAQYINEMHKAHASLYDYSEYMKSTDVALIEIRDGEVIMTSREAGVKMLCDPDDTRLAPIEALNFGAYEKEEMAMVLRILAPGDTVFDIGANFGWYSLNIGKTIPDVSIYAFEPLPKTHGYLKRNVALNTLDCVTINNFGFSSEAKEIPFYYCPDSSGSASAANIGERDDAEMITCTVKKLDDYVAEHGVTIDFIKCDVEGAELFVFQGGIETIKAQKPIIFSEMLRKWAAKYDYSPNAIIALLSEIGYACFTISEESLTPFSEMNEDTLETNFFFLHTEKHTDKIAELSR